MFWSTGYILSSGCYSIQHGFFKEVDLIKSTQSEIYFKQERECLLKERMLFLRPREIISKYRLPEFQ